MSFHIFYACGIRYQILLFYVSIHPSLEVRSWKLFFTLAESSASKYFSFILLTLYLQPNMITISLRFLRFGNRIAPLLLASFFSNVSLIVE